jgi:hypothetical protein
MERSLSDLRLDLDRVSCHSDELRGGVRRAVEVAAVDPEMALIRVRKVLEFVVRDVFTKKIKHPPGTRPLENLIDQLVKEGHVPPRIEAFTATIRKLGNVGAHQFGEQISTEDVYQSLTQLIPILEWYGKDAPAAVAQPQAVPLGPSAPPGPPPQQVVRPSRWRRAQRAARPAGRTTPPPLDSSRLGRGGFGTPDTAALASSFLWGGIGATAGSAIGANLGGILGALLFALGGQDARSGITGGEREISQFMDVAAVILGILGAVLGTVVAALAESRWRRHDNAVRGILAGATLGLLVLGICGLVGYSWIGRLSAPSPMWAIAGSSVGAVAGALRGAALLRDVPRGLAGALAGAMLLPIDALLVSEPWNLVPCLFFGALSGGLAEWLADLVAARDWGKRGFWLLAALALWSVVEMVAGDRFVPISVAMIALLGGTANAALRAMGGKATP